MRTWVLVALCCFAFVTAQDELEARNDTMMSSPHERAITTLVLLEIRKTLGVLSPRGRDHNILKVLLEEHKPLVNVTQWELQLNGRKSVFTDDDPMQTELEFGAELTDADDILIEAMNNKDITLGGVTAQLEIRDMKSRVARVGGEYDPAMSSLRVATGNLKEVQVEDKVCKEKNSPCYYLLTQLPENVPRCVSLNIERSDFSVVRHCDDSITSFREMPGRVLLNLNGDILTVEANFTTIPSKVEVVVFDPKEPTNMFSPDGFECQAKGEPRKLGYVCHQQVTEAQDLPRFSVLVVGLDREGFVLESRMDAYEGEGVSENSNKGVIVGSVIGVLVAIALIAGIFVYVKGKKETRSSSPQTRASNKYERTATTEPPSAQEDA